METKEDARDWGLGDGEGGGGGGGREDAVIVYNMPSVLTHSTTINNDPQREMSTSIQL